MGCAYLDCNTEEILEITVPTVAKKECYCNRDITAEELEDIVKQLREKEALNFDKSGKEIRHVKQFDAKDNPLYTNGNGDYFLKLKNNKGKEGYYLIGDNGKTTLKEYKGTEEIQRYTIEKTQYTAHGTELFNSNKSEKVTGTINYSIFASYLNGTFNTYDIKTCIRKIHFLAQCYHETGRFIHTYEGDDAITKAIGGKDFLGRGIKQITHDENYLAYYDHWNANNNMSTNSYLKIARGLTSKSKYRTVSKIIKNFPKKFPKDFLNTLKTFSKTLASDLQRACDSAGWFWSYKKGVYKAADDDNVDLLTKKINGGSKGLAKRKEYTQDLKEIFDYDNCKNK